MSESRFPYQEIRRELLKAVEKSTLYLVWKINHFNTSRTARELGMHRANLLRKFRELGIKAPQDAIRSEGGRLPKHVGEEEFLPDPDEGGSE